MVSRFLLFGAITVLTQVTVSWGHGRLMEPPSRASMWRLGYPNPADYNDNQGFCGGFQHQQALGGKCGICGDPWDASPRLHEAPGGPFANGIIAREYRPGQDIEVHIDITANHFGHFEFKLCANNDTRQDPDQSCFDGTVVRVLPDLSDRYVISPDPGQFFLKLRLPEDVYCDQCILQWTYVCGNNWGYCEDGTQAVGCGPQEWFRACSDIRITGDAIDNGGAGYTSATIFPSDVTQTTKPIRTTTTSAIATTKAPATSQPPAISPGPGLHLECRSVYPFKSEAVDVWCDDNCNHVPSFCPESHCACQHPISPSSGTSFSYFNFTAPVVMTTPAAASFSFVPEPAATTPAPPPPPRKKTKTKKPSKPIKKPKNDKKQRPVKYKKPSKSFFKSKSAPQSLTYGGSEKKSSTRAPQPPLKVSPEVSLEEFSGVTFKSLVGVERKVEVPTLITPVPLREAELPEQSIVKVPRPAKKPTKTKKRQKSKKSKKKKGSREKSKEFEDNPRESGVTFKAWVGVKMSSSDDVLNEISDGAPRRKSKSIKSDRQRPSPGRRRGRGKKGGRGRASKHPRRRSRPHPRRRHDPFRNYAKRVTLYPPYTPPYIAYPPARPYP